MREIPLTKGYVAKVDDEDYERLSRWNWYVLKAGTAACIKYYAIREILTNNCRQVIRMHKEILGCSRFVDHIDHDGLNNQRSNLREATRSQNGANRRKGVNTSSRFKGVSWCKATNKWKSEIRVNGKSRYLGIFKDEVDAATAYNLAALEEFGEYANYNIPLTEVSMISDPIVTEEKRPRPKPGEIRTYQVRIKLCAACGYRIDTGGLCSYDCDYDGEGRPAGQTLIAVWDRVDTFVKDEVE